MPTRRRSKCNKSPHKKGLQTQLLAEANLCPVTRDTLSKLHRNFLSIIRYGLLPSVGKHHRKPAGLQHALVFALARPQGQTARRIVPRHRNLRISAFLVIVIVELVFVKHETAVGTRINTENQVVPRLFRGILHVGTKRHDATSFYI